MMTRFMVVGVATGLAACLPAHIHETRLLQATDKTGATAYYELRIDGDAKLAKTSYRSGLYDAEALDALFSGVSDKDSDAVSQSLERRRKEAVWAIAGKYYQALGDSSASSRQIRALEDRLALAMRSAYEMSSTDDLLGHFAPKRKFVLILSARASEIEEAIAGFAEEKETSDTILTALASQKRREYLDTRAEQDRLAAALKVLRATRADMKGLTRPPAGPTGAYEQKVRSLLQTVAEARVP